MKYLSFLLIVFFASSCCSTKSVAETSQKDVVIANTNVEVKESDEIKELPVEQTETILPTEENNTVKVSLGTDGSVDENGVSETIEIVYTEAFNHEFFNKLLQKHVSEGGKVNYKGFKTDRSALRDYISLLGKFMPTEDWTKNDKLAYWINAYNAMTIDLIVRNYPLNSIKDIKDPWKQRLWKLGNKWYNLDEIEHQILRKMDEPRIHFGVVCASFSCPKLQNEAFTASQLEYQLTEATKEFLADSKRNNISQNEIKLSKIFKWFSKDFTENGTLIDFLNQYSDIQISSKAKKKYKDYNWDLND